MKSPVQLYLRVRLPDGSYPYLRAAYAAANGRLRPHHTIHAGRATEFPGSTYHLRYRINNKRVWEAVGADPMLALTCLQWKVLALTCLQWKVLALTCLQRKAVELQSTNEDAQRTERVSVAAPSPSITQEVSQHASWQILINDAIREYLTEMLAHKSNKTFAAYSATLYYFSPEAARQALAELPDDEDNASRRAALATLIERADETDRHLENKAVAQITRKDLLDFSKFLKEKLKSSPRTVHNRIDYLQIFLHHFGLPSLLKGKDLPQYTEKKVRAHNRADLARIFAKTQDEADLLHFFLCTGAREQEAQFVCWTDVDLELKTYTVTEHLDLGYIPKDNRELSASQPFSHDRSEDVECISGAD